MVGQAHVLGEILRRDDERHAGVAGRAEHVLVETLGVQVHLDGATGVLDGGKDGPPEIVVALGHAALDVDAEARAR